MNILEKSPFYSPYRYYFVIGYPYLTLSLIFSLFDATSDYSSLYVCDIIPLLPPVLSSNPSVFFALSLPPSLFPLNLYLSLTVTFPPYGSHLLSVALSLTHTYNSLSLSLSLTQLLCLSLSLSQSLSLSLLFSLFLSLRPTSLLHYLPCSLFQFHSLFLFLSLSLNLFLPLSIHSPLFLICSALFYSFSLPPFLFNTFVVSLSLALSICSLLFSSHSLSILPLFLFICPSVCVCLSPYLFQSSYS